MWPKHCIIKSGSFPHWIVPMYIVYLQERHKLFFNIYNYKLYRNDSVYIHIYFIYISIPGNTKRWPNVGLMMGQRRRRWTNIKPILGQCLVSAGIYVHCTIGHGVSALNCTARLKSPAVWACLGVDPPDMPRTLIGRAKENALNNPPCPITPTLTLSSHQLTTTFLSYYNVT